MKTNFDNRKRINILPSLVFVFVLLSFSVSLQSCKKNDEEIPSENSNDTIIDTIKVYDIQGTYSGLFINASSLLDISGWHTKRDTVLESVSVTHVGSIISNPGDVVTISYQIPSDGNLTSQSMNLNFDYQDSILLHYKIYPCSNGSATLTKYLKTNQLVFHVGCSDLSYSYSRDFSGY